ncbi:Surfeit locus protein 1 [Habropoda laboriosa]|uniref:SURF1-like protein n=1 Tax=Habropoda laboriosa TaxID=597456 RepID=A0A0L7R3E9_9HYME|nr:PREDICTED: surfeit locus protein 1 [Habropoda laboriosa]KOC65353.1 Surfeit locus protein 1 [Habropoda laboriosa]
MKSAIRRFFIKVKNPFNINIVQFLRKENYSQSSCNATNIKKQSSDVFKPNRFISENKYEDSKKINFTGYTLLGIPIAAFMLGTWQVHRYQWKLNLIEKLNSHINHEPIELPENLEALESKEYYPIKVRGEFIYEKEFIVGYRGLIVDGKSADNTLIGIPNAKMGFHIITPFKLANQDLTILVNRGWIPRFHKNPVKRQKNQIQGQTEIVGILRLNENRPPFVPKNRPHADTWYYRDVYAMAEKVDASPIYIELKSNNHLQEYPKANQTRVELRNEHLSYILTWYCLSAATGYMWFKKFIRGIPLIL